MKNVIQSPANLSSLAGHAAPHFDGLDVVRTGLSMLVALGHFFLWNGVTHRVPGTFFLAVDFFFALSGFVLTQSVLNDKSRTASEFIKHFATRRFFRLFPLYIMIFVIWVPLLLIQRTSSGDSFFQYLIGFLMIHALGFATADAHIFADTSIGIGWSISVEFWVGLAFFIGIYSLRKQPTVLAGACAFIALFGLLLMINFSSNFMNVNLQKFKGIATFGEIRGLIGFAFGCLGYLLYIRVGRTPLRSAGFFTCFEFAIIALTLLLFAHTGAYHHDNEFVAPFLAPAMIVLVALRRGILSRLLYSKWLSLLRPLSYSIYLVHPLYVYAFRQLHIGFDSGTHALIYTGLVAATAALLYEGVERKFIVIGKRFGKSSSPAVPDLLTPTQQDSYA